MKKRDLNWGVAGTPSSSPKLEPALPGGVASRTANKNGIVPDCAGRRDALAPRNPVTVSPHAVSRQ